MNTERQTKPAPTWAKPAPAETARHALHVSLLQELRGMPKAIAIYVAWLDGPNGLDKLLETLRKGETQ
jgi:hypothetical protein